MKKVFVRWMDFIWYKDHFVALLLFPFSMIYEDFVRFRRFLYRKGLLKSGSLPVPVIVIGNISVGGTGKTPLLIWIAALLKKSGYSPGIISRGYQGAADSWPQWVSKTSDPRHVGDEAILIARHSHCPVIVDPERGKAAQLLIEKTDCDVILSDDGLQHYALARDVEIAVIDGQRRFGNGYCLPAGPLREPISRLQEVDLVICNGPGADEGEFTMQVEGNVAVNLLNGEQLPLQEFSNKSCHAVAGIGNPGRFFNLLKEAGLRFKKHMFPDHYDFCPDDFRFNDSNPILMTEKDAVKCESFAELHYWYVPIQVKPGKEFSVELLKLLR